MMREKLSALTMVAIVATGISIVACGGNVGTNNTATACTFDDDCDIGQFCDQDAGVCVEPCTSNTDCNLGEECVERTSTDTTKVCRPSTSTNNTNNVTMGCTENEECGDNQVCLDGTCMDLSSNNNNQTPQYFVVQILDESSGSGSCESTTNGEGDPGSDIMFVRLLNDQGEPIGFGEQLSYNATDDDVENGFISASHIDGDAPDIDDSSCPIEENNSKFRADSILALGCGGHLLVRFLDMSGTPVPLLAGYQVEVGEYDAECNSSGNSGSDRYAVYLCENTSDASSGGTGSCSRELGSDQVGISSNTVSLP